MKVKTMKLGKSVVAALLVAGTLVLGCGKGNKVGPGDPADPDNNTGTVFKPADFEVYDVADNSSPSFPNSISTNYKVRNKSNKDYVSSTKNGYFEVYMRAKGSDGAWYDDTEPVDDLNAGASHVDQTNMSAPEGINLDKSSLEITIRVDE